MSISFVWVCFQDQGLTCNEVAMQMQVKFYYCESLVLIKFSLKETQGPFRATNQTIKKG